MATVIKVLLAEDNEDNLYMLKTRLELLGDFEVLAAENSENGYKTGHGRAPGRNSDGPRNASHWPLGNPFGLSRQIRKPATHSDYQHIRVCAGERA